MISYYESSFSPERFNQRFSRSKIDMIIALYNHAIRVFESPDYSDALYLFSSCLRHCVELLNAPYSRLDSYEITVLTRYISLCNGFISRCEDII